MRREEGFSLVTLLASCTIVLILMTALVPAWSYVMKDDREQELLHRGFEIADAVQKYQSKNANALPTSLDVLVKGKYLRKAYKDPMVRDGKWRLLHQGEVVVPQARTGSLPGSAPLASPSPAASPMNPSTLGAPAGTSVGGIVGVASRSKEASLRLFNGRSHYNEWIFAVGQPRVIGKTAQLPVGGTRPPGTPPQAQGITPSPSP